MEVQVPAWPPVIHGRRGAPLYCWEGKESGHSPGLPCPSPGWVGHRPLSTTPHLSHWHQTGIACKCLVMREVPRLCQASSGATKRAGKSHLLPSRCSQASLTVHGVGLGSSSGRRKWVWGQFTTTQWDGSASFSWHCLIHPQLWAPKLGHGECGSLDTASVFAEGGHSTDVLHCLSRVEQLLCKDFCPRGPFSFAGLSQCPYGPYPLTFPASWLLQGFIWDTGANRNPGSFLTCGSQSQGRSPPSLPQAAAACLLHIARPQLLVVISRKHSESASTLSSQKWKSFLMFSQIII